MSQELIHQLLSPQPDAGKYRLGSRVGQQQMLEIREIGADFDEVVAYLLPNAADQERGQRIVTAMNQHATHVALGELFIEYLEKHEASIDALVKQIDEILKQAKE